MKFPHKYLLLLIFIISFFILAHNVLFYPYSNGYDATAHIGYSQIISKEFRIPLYKETRESIHPPFFYFISGAAIRVYSWIFGSSFIQAINVWRFISVLLTIISFWLWYQIYLLINPKQKKGAVFFVLFLASLPPIYKAVAMFTPESFNLFLATIIIWFYIKYFLKKPDYKKIIILSLLVSLALLTKISFFSLAMAVAIGILLAVFLNKQKYQKAVIFLSLYFLIIFFSTGWFYYGRHEGKLLQFGEWGLGQEKKNKDVPIYKRQRLAFYYDVPFKLMMTYPVRPHLSFPTYLIPIYYSDFWGDYWNFFSQRRFAFKEKERRGERYFFLQERIKYLAWQNQINLLPSCLMVIAFLFFLIKRILELIKGKLDYKNTGELFLFSFVFFAWGGLLMLVSKYTGEGDFIKATYMLLVVPIYVYFVSVFLFSYLRKNKVIFWSVFILLLFTIVNNLIFAYF